MKVFKLFFGVILLLSTFVACDKEEYDDSYSPSGSDIETDLEPPSFDKYLTTTDLDGFSVRARFNNGGDASINMSCILYWEAYSSKPSRIPSASELSHAKIMMIYSSTKEKTVFDTSHAGYGVGTYIYYYMECKNSKYSCTTPMTYTVVTR